MKIQLNTLNTILKALGVSVEEFEKFDANAGEKLYKIHQEDSSISVLKERVERYQKENKNLKEIIQNQKKLITLLEKRKK